jgi:enoyl-CoA hydratase/carnithine racemase
MAHVLVETAGAVRIVRLNRPEKKNALTASMYADLVATMNGASTDSNVRALVVLGAPGVFTAGNDLKDFMQSPPTGNDSPVFQFLLALAEFPKPLIAGVDGHAVGIGTTMLLHCDYVVATESARLHMPFLNLGLVPEGGSSVLLPALVGMQRASELLLLGEPFSGADAARFGVVNQLCSAADLESVTLGIASKFAARPAEAMRLSKELIRAPHREAVRDAIAREGELFMARLQSVEAQEAFVAFMAKRA